jgi:plastocyanin
MTLRYRDRIAALVLLAGLVAVSGSCSEHEDPTEPNGEAVEIELVNFAFDDDEVTVEAGTTIRWINTTIDFHTVTPDGHSAWAEWQTNGAGETFEVTLSTPGTYDYFCAPHQSIGMTGRIIVTE